VESNETNRFFWEPAEVWEIRGADLTKSPVHTAGLGIENEEGAPEEERGIGLRFPRFIRKRPDKTPQQATTAQQIARMYKAQFN